jgi:hypothetical protein
MKRPSAALGAGRLLLLVALARAAAAEEPRLPPPDPARGERYDGRTSAPPDRDWAYWPGRVALFPFRLLFWGLEPPAHYTTELEQRHNIYRHLHDLMTSRDGLIGLRPEAQWTLSFKPSFGALFFDERSLGYETSLRALAMGGPDVAHAELLVQPIPFSWPVQLTVGGRYDRRNDHLFAGIDNTLPVPPGQLGPSRFLADALDFDAVVGLRLVQPLVLSFGAAFGWRQFADGEPYNGDPSITEVWCVRLQSGACIPNTVSNTLVPGFNSGTRFFRASAGLTLDLRDSLAHATTGFLLSVGADYSHGLAGDDSNYFRLFGAGTLPINLWRHRHVLLASVATEILAPIGIVPVPFSELPTLGGPDNLRGFRTDIFRGQTSFIVTGEYRFPVWMWMDAVIFADYGGVLGQWYAGFGRHQLQPDLGVGLRMFGRDHFWLRVQLAYGWGEGWRFTLSTLSWP